MNNSGMRLPVIPSNLDGVQPGPSPDRNPNAVKKAPTRRDWF